MQRGMPHRSFSMRGNAKKGKEMKRTLIAFGFLSAISFGSALATETKVEGRIYGSWWMYVTDSVFVSNGDYVDHKGWSQFSLDRSYMTMKSMLTDYTSVNLTTDLNTKGGFSGYDVILKYGYAAVKMPFWTPLVFSLGLQPTKYPEFVDNQVWGHRYLEKNIGDRLELLTTSDLGATLDYAIGQEGKNGSAGVSLWNGTKYSDVSEKNKNKDLNLYAGLRPLADNADFSNSAVGAQVYLGTQNEVIDTSLASGDFKRQIISVAGKVNYRDYFDFGLDYWSNTLGQVDSLGNSIDDLKQNAFMVYGVFYFKNVVSETSLLRTLDLLLRYDMFDPNTDTENNKENLLIAGFECAPAKGINASLNYRSYSFEAGDKDSQNYIYLNTEFKF
jgi:hypothetical protein